MVRNKRGLIDYEPLAGELRTTARCKAFAAPMLVFIGRGQLNAGGKDSTPFPRLISETFTEVHMVSFPVGIYVQFSNMIFQGVPERFPKLRLAFLEIGCTWLPYWLDRMDEHWDKRGKIETPQLNQRPSDCVRQRPIYFSMESEETLLAETFRYLGDDHFLYATDIPHWDSEFPDNLRVAQSRTDLSDQTKRKLLYDNAKALYGI